MTVLGITIGPRKSIAVAVAGVGLVVCSTVAGVLGMAWPLVVLGVGAGSALCGAGGLIFVKVRRQQRMVTVVAARREIMAVRTAPHEVRGSLDGISRASEADMRREYLAKGLHQEPDTFVLYRIIGNDLPPRHKAGQSVENLRFLLEHEPQLAGCEKRWVLNRILDPETETQVIQLLEQHGMSYLHIPFDPDEYRRVRWRFNEFRPGFSYRELDMLSAPDQMRALDHIYHDKNLYVMNNNGARNAALRQGRERAKWVLPWDGNCFVTADAWNELVRVVTGSPHLKYFIVPMARVLDNDILLQPDPLVVPNEEPQILFRRDAREEFDSDSRYGRRPKVELFSRLGIPGPWDSWASLPWDIPAKPLSPDAGQFGQASWVARLFSGQRSAEGDARDRTWKRIEAIRSQIDQVDEQLAGEMFDPAALFTLNDGACERQRKQLQVGEPGPVAVAEALVGQARRVLDERAGTSWRPSSGADAFPQLVDDAMTVILAGFFTGEQHHLAAGAHLVRSALLDRRTGMHPRGARAFWGRGRRWPVQPAGLHYLLDGIRLLERAEVLQPDVRAALRQWFTEHRSFLLGNMPERVALDHRGTWYDVRLAAVEAYLGNVRGLLDTLRRAQERVGQQFQADGRPPAELTGPRTQDNCVYNLAGWSHLAGYAQQVGQDLWSYHTPDGGSLVKAAKWVFDRSHGPWPYEQQSPFDTDRLCALAFEIAGKAPSLAVTDLLDRACDPWVVRQLFAPGAQVRPFWVLGNMASVSQPDAAGI